MAIGTGAAILGATALSVGGSMLSAKKQSGAIGDAANSQAEAQLRATQMQLDFLRESRSDIADAVDAGLIDLNTGFNMAIQQIKPLTGLDELNAARQLLADPSAIMERPSVQFQREQGLDALQAAFSRTSGGGLTGRGVQAAQQFGQNLASTSLDAELNRLFPFINMAASARQNISSLEAGRGQARSGLRIGGATGTGQITGQAVPSIAQGITAQGNIAANQALGQANVFTGQMSNMANIASQMLNIGAVRPELFSFGASGVSSSPTPVPSGAFNPAYLAR